MNTPDPTSDSRVQHSDFHDAWRDDIYQPEDYETVYSYLEQIDEGEIPLPYPGYGSNWKLISLARVTAWGVEFDEYSDDEFAGRFIDDIGNAFNNSEFDESIDGSTADIELDDAENLLNVEPTVDTARAVRLDEDSRNPSKSGQARTRAALLSIGRASTKKEIAERSGLSLASVGSYLSALPDVVRADKTRWGLAEWVEDEYEGIPAEIIQRIVEDGGSTRLNRLLDELPRLFGVSEASVRSSISTPAFRLENGWVSQVEEPDAILGELDDVADGRDINSDPYWTFEVHDRYLRGYSITGVPPELAVSLGCQWGDSETVAVRNPRECPDLSVIWRRTSSTGAEIGRVATALKAIEVSDGHTACVIFHKEGDVSVVRKPEIQSVATASKISSPLKGLKSKSHISNRKHPGVTVGPTLRASLINASRDDLEKTDNRSIYSQSYNEIEKH